MIKQGLLQAKGRKFAIVASRFNDFITRRLLEGSFDCLLRHGCSEKDIDVVWVPGTVESVFALSRLSNAGKHDAIICLGATIRGETPHFDYVNNQVVRAVAQANMSGNVPVCFGVITADSTDQAIARAGSKHGNKGWDAALSAIEMADLSKGL